MICDNCYHHLECERNLTEEGRCAFYLKDRKVAIDDNVEVNPMDTEQFDYDDIRRLFGDELMDKSSAS